MKPKTSLKELFYTELTKGIRRKRLNTPVTYEKYKEIIISCVNLLNIFADESFFLLKYDIYLQKFMFKPTLSNIGFYSLTTTNLQYYIDRGWNLEEANNFLNKRQSTISLNSFIQKYGQKEGNERFLQYVDKHSRSFSKNYKNGKHSNFFRPSNIEYWLNKGLSEELAKQEMHNCYSLAGKKQYEKRRDAGEEFLTVRQLKYWVNKKGLSIEQAKKELSIRYGTRSLDYCIEKYGETLGKIKFIERNEKWLATLNNKTEEEKLEILKKKTIRLTRYSKKSIDLFNIVLKEIKDKYNLEFSKIYMAEKEFYIYDEINKKINFYDLMIKDLNLIVEYNGIKFHPNKNILSNDEWNVWYNVYSGLSAEEQLKIDEYKRNLALRKKYHYIIIWENETVEKSKNIIINKILEIYENRIN